MRPLRNGTSSRTTPKFWKRVGLAASFALSTGVFTGRRSVIDVAVRILQLHIDPQASLQTAPGFR